MFPTVVICLTFFSQSVTSSDLIKQFTEFSDYRALASSGVSPQCVLNVAKLGNAARKFFTTAALCVKSGGCTDKENKVLKENIFAAKELDAFGKLPAGILEATLISSGSYYECMHVDAPYDTQYCYATMSLGNATGGNPPSMMGAKLAVCMPANCTEQDIRLLMQTVVRTLPMGLPLEFTSASCVPTSPKLSTAFWTYMAFLALFVLWAVLATIVDYMLDKHSSNEVIKRNKGVQAFLSFSFYSSTSLLLDMRPQKEGSLRSLACIRFISMTWVAAGHTLGESANSDSFGPVFAAINPLPSTTFTNAFLSVDTFFLLSGVLAGYLFFKNRPSSRLVKNPLTWVLFYVHRYLRLTPPIMMFIGFYTVMAPLIAGPWAASSGADSLFGIEACQKYWWHNLLYINNFFGFEEGCYPITWYLAVDTQLYVVAPIFLIALFISPFVGAAILVLCCAASVAYIYAITYIDDLPATVFSVLALSKTTEFMDIYYQMPWTRCPPYLIGIGVGYILANAKGKKPRLHWMIIVAIWLVATAVGVASVYTPHEYIKGDDNWSKFVRATYNNFSRIGWALAVSWVIAANHLGWGGPIAPFMDHALWQPLGRLSYCAYIVHFYVIMYVFNLDDQPMHFVSLWDSYVYRAIPVIVLSYAFALVWSCLFEVPTAKLEKMLIAAILPTKEKVHPTADKKTQPRPIEDGVRCEKTEDLRL
ncbi:hypothetical protein Q1695_008808 [Nippostrongylus brasiliensis]|nr:hypothetical protein Q1695_008808 [Nippostrongylus brasiliensis]